jgi:hypothetical protein
MKTRLQISLDDHSWKIIVDALREQAKHKKSISETLHLLIAGYINREVTQYQNEQQAVLMGLREVKQQIAAGMEDK